MSSIFLFTPLFILLITITEQNSKTNGPLIKSTVRTGFSIIDLDYNTSIPDLCVFVIPVPERSLESENSSFIYAGRAVRNGTKKKKTQMYTATLSSSAIVTLHIKFRKGRLHTRDSCGNNANDMGKLKAKLSVQATAFTNMCRGVLLVVHLNLKKFISVCEPYFERRFMFFSFMVQRSVF